MRRERSRSRSVGQPRGGQVGRPLAGAAAEVSGESLTAGSRSNRDSVERANPEGRSCLVPAENRPSRSRSRGGCSRRFRCISPQKAISPVEQARRSPPRADLAPTSPFKPQLPNKAPAYVGQFDGAKNSYLRWVRILGLNDQQTRDFAINLLTGEAADWAEAREEVHELSWKDFKDQLCKAFQTESLQVNSQRMTNFESHQERGQSMRSYLDKKRLAGRLLGRSEHDIKMAIVKGLRPEYLYAVKNFKSGDLDAVEQALLDFNELLDFYRQGKRSPVVKPSCVHCKRTNHQLDDCFFKNKEKAMG